jgi:hypothetical protein
MYITPRDTVCNTSPCLSIYKRHGEMAVYDRGEQEKERNNRETKAGKTKARVCAIDVIWYQTQLAVVNALNNTTELTRQGHHISRETAGSRRSRHAQKGPRRASGLPRDFTSYPSKYPQTLVGSGYMYSDWSIHRSTVTVLTSPREPFHRLGLGFACGLFKECVFRQHLVDDSNRSASAWASCKWKSRRSEGRTTGDHTILGWGGVVEGMDGGLTQVGRRGRCRAAQILDPDGLEAGAGANEEFSRKTVRRGKASEVGPM